MEVVRLLVLTVVVIAIVAFIAYVVVAQFTNSGSSNAQSSKSINVVLDDMQKVQGKRIAVSGYVKTSMAPYALLVGSSDSSQTGLLVVAKRRVPRQARMAQRVSAVGVAQPFDLASFRRRHPGITDKQLRESPLRRLAGNPALVDATIVVQRAP